MVAGVLGNAQSSEVGSCHPPLGCTCSCVACMSQDRAGMAARSEPHVGCGRATVRGTSSKQARSVDFVLPLFLPFVAGEEEAESILELPLSYMLRMGIQTSPSVGAAAKSCSTVSIKDDGVGMCWGQIGRRLFLSQEGWARSVSFTVACLA